MERLLHMCRRVFQLQQGSPISDPQPAARPQPIWNRVVQVGGGCECKTILPLLPPLPVQRTERLGNAELLELLENCQRKSKTKQRSYFGVKNERVTLLYKIASSPHWSQPPPLKTCIALQTMYSITIYQSRLKNAS